MKLTLLTVALLLSPLALRAQTDAMPPENKAPMQDSMPMKAPVPPSHQVIINFQGHTTTLTVEDLLKMPQVTVHVHNEHRNADESYSGPLLSDVLAKAGLAPSKENQPLILHSAVVATGTDKYYVLYSVAEVEPGFSKGQVIVALMKGNDLPDTEGGAIQIVNTTDAKPARWLHGLTQLNVVSMNQN
ncbi:molybdopterin-binding protein [Granulicella paludicola]|uniref:molybdopterin-dependent oxidoreductase n=1 Tax=Granulicella paludicola TaxID=474951 RepID=UPI0021E0A405|nr:molybdopterin-dependent oxidoreductase [Granulicella paludicola]